MARELLRAQSQPLPTLESYTLLMGAIALMHRLSLQDFDRAKQMLQTLTERAPRQAIPWAWMAKWHVLRVQQGWSQDLALDARLAMDCTRTSAGCRSALLAGAGHRRAGAHESAEATRHRAGTVRAARCTPTRMIRWRWLLKGTLHAFRGEGKAAVEGHATRAAAFAARSAALLLRFAGGNRSALGGQYERAIKLAEHSLRANRTHTSTFRALAISQWQLGRQEDARKTVGELMRLEPDSYRGEMARALAHQSLRDRKTVVRRAAQSRGADVGWSWSRAWA